MKQFSHLLNLKLLIGHFSISIPFNLILIILNSLILTIYFIFVPNSFYYHNFTHFECHQKSKIPTLSLSTNHSLTRYTSLTIYTSLYLNLINIYVNEMQYECKYTYNQSTGVTILPTLENFILEIELKQMRVLVSHVFLSLPSGFLTSMVFPQHFYQRYDFNSQHFSFSSNNGNGLFFIRQIIFKF